MHSYERVDHALQQPALADVGAAVINGEEKGMRGVTLASLLVVRPARVVVTGTNRQTEAEVRRECPGATFLLKPFLIETLLAALHL